MQSDHGTRIYQDVEIVLPDKTRTAGSLWRLDTGTLYVELADQSRYVVATLAPDGIVYILADEQGNPVKEERR